MYEISTDKPLPRNWSIRPGRGRRRIYPLADLEPGQSFAVPASKASSARHAVEKWAHRHPGWEYVTAWDGEELRIWRAK